MTKQNPNSVWSSLAVQEGQPTFLLLEAQVTKRKSVSYVLSEREEVLFASISEGDCFEWLLAKEVKSIVLLMGDQRVQLHFSTIPEGEGV